MWDLAECARALGMKVHVDGARFANAVAALGCAPADLAWRAGVDVLSFGGTKNGMQFGEAVVFFDAALAEEFGRRRMQGGQLASKMRFLAAPWVGVLGDGAWLRHATHANAMAARLATAIGELPGARLLAPVEANGVFVDLPQSAIDALRAKGWQFYIFVGETGARFLCSWDTTADGVDALIADLRVALRA
jgi:threonine aldolase